MRMTAILFHSYPRFRIRVARLQHGLICGRASSAWGLNTISNLPSAKTPGRGSKMFSDGAWRGMICRDPSTRPNSSVVRPRQGRQYFALDSL